MAEQHAYGDSERVELDQFIPATAQSVLDVGCWQGGFGAASKRKRPGCVVWAIESNRECAAVAATRLDRVINGRFPEEMPVDEHFDLVVFLDVLEHLVDPWSALRHASSLLRPGDVVVASIPNVLHVSVTFPLLARGLWEYQDEGLLDQTHLRFFTRRSMETLFRSSGYEVERIEAINLSDGKTGAILRLGGRWAEEFRAAQYVVVAHPK
jgi:2-polyprenyl-3-methyl-5-hydroxy-6-metoxy-1,4-benzoquinol methylase